jgi:hypothetical protein
MNAHQRRIVRRRDARLSVHPEPFRLGVRTYRYGLIYRLFGKFRAIGRSS